ncbi:MAG: hypothetical protein ACYSTS_19470, partial [Planctomycetota bacterium]
MDGKARSLLYWLAGKGKIVRAETCPVCKEDNLIVEFIKNGEKSYVMNKLSRKDNRTYICGTCGLREAFPGMS